MSYGKEIKEFAKVRCEQTSNNTQIARDIKNKFSINKEVELIRRAVSDWRMKWNNCKQQYRISNKNYMGLLEYLSKCNK